MGNRRFIFACISFAILFLTGCSARSPIVSEWRNPAYTVGAFNRILVGGLASDTSIRRNFEDEFVSQLRAVGVDAVPSYRILSDEEKIDEARLREAAQKAGADALLFTGQTLGLLLAWLAGSDHGLGMSANSFPIAYETSEYVAYGAVNLVIVLTGTGLVLLGCRVRAQRTARRNVVAVG